MKLFIKPTFDNIREDLGYDEFEDVDEDAIMFQQGYDGDIMEVEDGESFEIPKGYVARNTIKKIKDSDIINE